MDEKLYAFLERVGEIFAFAYALAIGVFASLMAFTALFVAFWGIGRAIFIGLSSMG